MTEKSHVSMGVTICPVCGAHELNDEVLIDKRMRKVLNKHTFRGVKLCAEHAMHSNEYLALVEVNSLPKSGEVPDFTGKAAQLRRHVVAGLFGEEIAPNVAFIYVEAGTVAKLEELSKSAPPDDVA